MEVTPNAVAAERKRLQTNADRYVKLINQIRDKLGPLFDTEVAHVTVEAFDREVTNVFADGDRAANITGLMGLLREVEVTGDYPGFIVDELLGREIAGMIAGGQPARLLAEATFHYCDVHHDPSGSTAGEDDLEAAIVAGFQTRMEGWTWQASPSPFAIDEE